MYENDFNPKRDLDFTTESTEIDRDLRSLPELRLLSF